MSENNKIISKEEVGEKSISTGERVLDVAADYGRIKTLIISIILSVIFIIVSFFIVPILYKEEEYPNSVEGKVTSKNCTNNSNNNNVNNNCNISVQYTVNNKEYNKNFYISNYDGSSTITVWYKTENPESSTVNRMSKKGYAIILLVVLLITLCSWMIWYFSKKSKAFAASQAVFDTISVIRSPFSR